MGNSILETGAAQTTRVAVNRDEIIARIERLDRIVDALKAMAQDFQAFVAEQTGGIQQVPAGALAQLPGKRN